MPLSHEQAAFVAHGHSGHARLLAGPGTGKSFTSVEFLKELAQLDPKPRCHMITFTRAATRELVEKVEGAPDITSRPPSTAHSFAMSLLMRADNPGTLRMADDWEKRWIVQVRIKERLVELGHNVDIKVVEKLTDEMAAGWQALDSSKLQLSGQEPALAAAFVGAWKEAARTFDFIHISEVPFKAVQYFETSPIDLDVDVLIVDEYQDLNHAEVRLLELVSDVATLIAIGDDDQSIYGWRNADPHALLSFCSDFPGAGDYELSVCHRCPPEILEPATAVIASAPGRQAKTPLTSVAGASGFFAQVHFPNSDAEFAGAADAIAKRIAAGVKPKDIAVLVRSSPTKYRDELQPYCDAVGVKLLSVDWAKDALKQEPVRRLLAIGRLINEPTDSLAWATLLRVTSGIGDTTLSKLYAGACSAGVTFHQQLMAEHANDYPSISGASRSRVRTAVEETLAILGQLQGEQDGAQLGDTGWGGWLLTHQGAQQVNADGAKLFNDVGADLLAENSDMSLSSFVTQFSQRALDLAESDETCVRVMSMSSSKGLTVDTTILLAVDDDTVPSPRALSEDEERRILYVAMTRATAVSIITFAQVRSGPTAFIGNAGPQRQRSRFLTSLPGVPAPIDGATLLASLP
jgi:DNA helicase-2/ATP-dependent DNA helicase PcrA